VASEDEEEDKEVTIRGEILLADGRDGLLSPPSLVVLNFSKLKANI
jgi:hypothetical protein